MAEFVCVSYGSEIPADYQNRGNIPDLHQLHAGLLEHDLQLVLSAGAEAAYHDQYVTARAVDPGLGALLAELFFEAGIRIVETGTIQSSGAQPSLEEWKIEWEVIEADLQGWVPDEELQHMKALDQAARENGERLMHVPTYFAWGRV